MATTGNSKTSKKFSPSKQPFQFNFQQAFLHFHSQFSGLVHHLSHNFSNFNPQAQLQSLQTQARDTFLRFNQPLSSPRAPALARIAETSNTQTDLIGKSGTSLSNEDIEERLAGVPVYALTNSEDDFVLISGTSSKKSLGLLCLKEEDAETLLREMKSMNPGMGKEGSRVVAVALNKVFQLKVNGVSFRLIPEATQVNNALKEREKAGFSDNDFPGVPVFQSRSLVLRSQNKRYRPVFFRKEDLEKSLLKASREQNKLNPLLIQGDIQVAAFEDIVKGMRDSSVSDWDDVVFIPPGFDVSATSAVCRFSGKRMLGIKPFEQLAFNILGMLVFREENVGFLTALFLHYSHYTKVIYDQHGVRV